MANSKTKRKRRSDILLDQRRAVVEFGRTALRNPDLGEILTEACRHCGQAMATDLSKVMELQPESDELLVIAGIGWKKGVVGQERVPAIRRSSEGYALRTGNPAVSARSRHAEHCGHVAIPELNDAGTMETSHHWRLPRSVWLTSQDTLRTPVNDSLGEK